MKEYLNARLIALSARINETTDAFRRGKLGWLYLFTGCLIAASLTFLVFRMEKKGFFAPRKAVIGHIVRAYGTVTRTMHGLGDGWGRLPTGRNLAVAVALGDQVQTGDDSAAQILFFGGSTLQLEAGTVMRFELDDDDISMRVIMGRAFLEYPAPEGERQFVFRRGDGSLADVPPGMKLVLTLSAVDRLEDAVEVQVVESDHAPEAIANLEMRYLAHGEEVGESHPVLVRPIEERDKEIKSNESHRMLATAPRVEPTFPEQEEFVDVEKPYGISMKWPKPVPRAEDPVVSYEVLVKPAFGYEVEDSARKRQALRAKTEDIMVEKVGGSGVFLWAVRPVTASGKRGPASQYRWIEVKFPLRLMAPELRKPRIE